MLHSFSLVNTLIFWGAVRVLGIPLATNLCVLMDDGHDFIFGFPETFYVRHTHDGSQLFDHYTLNVVS